MFERWSTAALATVAAVVVLVTSIRLGSASGALRRETARLEGLCADLEELRRLRLATADALSAAPPEGDLLRAVREVIRGVGLPDEVFVRLVTSGEAPAKGRDGYTQRTCRLELEGLDATDIGALLGQWRDAEPLWAVERIELQHRPPGRPGESRAGYTVVFALSTVFVSGSVGETGRRP